MVLNFKNSNLTHGVVFGLESICCQKQSHCAMFEPPMAFARKQIIQRSSDRSVSSPSHQQPLCSARRERQAGSDPCFN